MKYFCRCCQCDRQVAMVAREGRRGPNVLVPDGWIEVIVRQAALVVRICPRCQRRTANHRAVMRADALAAGLPWPPPWAKKGTPRRGRASTRTN